MDIVLAEYCFCFMNIIELDVFHPFVHSLINSLNHRNLWFVGVSVENPHSSCCHYNYIELFCMYFNKIVASNLSCVLLVELSGADFLHK
jgi:hypothetical protein